MHAPSLHDGTCSPFLHGRIFRPRSFAGRAMGFFASSNQQSSFVLHATGGGAGGGSTFEGASASTTAAASVIADAGADEAGAGAIGSWTTGATGAVAASFLHARMHSASAPQSVIRSFAGEILTPLIVP